MNTPNHASQFRSFEELEKSLKSTIESLESYRIKQRRKLLLYAFLGITGAALVVYLSFTILSFLGGWGFIIAAACLYPAAATNLGYQKHVKQTLVQSLVNSIDKSFQYSTSQGLLRERFDESHLFPNYTSYGSEDYITGKIGKTAFEMGEVTLHQDMGGDNVDKLVFKGLVLIADFNKHFQTKTFVLPDAGEKLFGDIATYFQSFSKKKGELIYLEDPEFEKNYKVYADDEIEARYILSSSLMMRLNWLKDKVGKYKVYISFVNEKMFVAIDYGYWKNLFEVNIHKSLKKNKNVKVFYNQMLACVSMIDELNLNTRIWSKL